MPLYDTTNPLGIISLPNVIIGETAIVALSSGIRKVTITGVTGVIKSDKIILTPIDATPALYAIADVTAIAANTLQVTVNAPLLALGASYSIPCTAVVIR